MPLLNHLLIVKKLRVFSSFFFWINMSLWLMSFKEDSLITSFGYTTRNGIIIKSKDVNDFKPVVKLLSDEE